MIKIIYSIIVSLLTIVLVGEGYPNHIDKSFIGVILLVNLFSVVIFFTKNENNPIIKKQHIRTSNLFIIGFIIVHFQMYIDLFWGFVSEDNIYLFINNRIATKSLLISSIALNVFFLGYELNKTSESVIEVPKFNSDILNTRLLFFLSFFFLFLYFITVNKSYLAGNYGKVEKGEIASYASFLFENVMASLLIIKARNILIRENFNVNLKRVLYYMKAEIILLSIYLISIMISGERDLLILNGLFLVGILMYSSKIKIKISYIFIFVGIAAFTLTLLGAARNFKDEGNTFFDKITIALESNTDNGHYTDSFLNSTKELASSGRTLNIAVDAMEQGNRHTYGLFALQDLMLLIPSLKGTVINMYEIPNFLTSSAQYLTYLDQGAHPIWGVGTSCVADTYIDFGVVGIIIFYLLFGFIVRRSELMIYNKKIVSFIPLTASLLLFSYSVYISRATVLYSLSRLFYVITFIYIILLTNKKHTY